MASERLSQLIQSVRETSYQTVLQTPIDWHDKRPLRSGYAGESSYDIHLPEIFGDPLSYYIEKRAKNSENPLTVFDAGCGPMAVAVRQGKELFGDSIYWVGMDATIERDEPNGSAFYIDARDLIAREKAVLYAGNAPLTLVSGDIQSAPELLAGMDADVVVANKTLQYLGDPWGFMAQLPLCMGEHAVFVANEIPIDTVIPELKSRALLERFLRFCTNQLRMYFTHDAQEIGVFHRSALVWDYQRGMQIPLRYTGDSTKVVFVLTDTRPDAFVVVTTLTYSVAWDKIEQEGY